MTRNRIYLSIVALVIAGAFSLYVRLSEREPEVMRNALICRDCGKELPYKD